MDASTVISRYTQVQHSQPKSEVRSDKPGKPDERKLEEQRIHKLLDEARSFFEELDSSRPVPEEIAQQRRQRRAEEAAQLARRYVEQLGMNINAPDGRTWFEKTVKFYGSNDTLLGRLRDLVGSLPAEGAPA